MADDFYAPKELARRMDCLEREWANGLVERGMPVAAARRKARDMMAAFDLIEMDDQGHVRRSGLDLSKY